MDILNSTNSNSQDVKFKLKELERDVHQKKAFYRRKRESRSKAIHEETFDD